MILAEIKKAYPAGLPYSAPVIEMAAAQMLQEAPPKPQGAPPAVNGGRKRR